MKRLFPLFALLVIGAASADESADLDAASAGLTKLCGDLPPNTQLQEAKLNASYGSDN